MPKGGLYGNIGHRYERDIHMKPTLAAARLLSILAAWAILPLPAPLHGASPGFPFAEDFQSPPLLDSTDTTARWTNNGVT